MHTPQKAGGARQGETAPPGTPGSSRETWMASRASGFFFQPSSKIERCLRMALSTLGGFWLVSK